MLTRHPECWLITQPSIWLCENKSFHCCKETRLIVDFQWNIGHRRIVLLGGTGVGGSKFPFIRILTKNAKNQQKLNHLIPKGKSSLANVLVGRAHNYQGGGFPHGCFKVLPSKWVKINGLDLDIGALEWSGDKGHLYWLRTMAWQPHRVTRTNGKSSHIFKLLLKIISSINLKVFPTVHHRWHTRLWSRWHPRRK